MFNGSWKESNEEHINLEIPDDNIDVEGKDSFKIIYYPTAPHRVQITPKTGTNITWYLYSRGPVRQVGLPLTNQFAGFPAPIPFRFA